MSRECNSTCLYRECRLLSTAFFSYGKSLVNELPLADASQNLHLRDFTFAHRWILSLVRHGEKRSMHFGLRFFLLLSYVYNSVELFPEMFWQGLKLQEVGGNRDYNYAIHCCYVMGYSALRRAAASALWMYHYLWRQKRIDTMSINHIRYSQS